MSKRKGREFTVEVNLGQARQIIGRWVEFYNTRRLHAGLKYLAPAEYWAGDPQARFEERTRSWTAHARAEKPSTESVSGGRLIPRP